MPRDDLQIELILVPFDVESQDTALARSPLELQKLGLIERLESLDLDLWTRVIGSRQYDEPAVTVSGIARAVSRRVSRARTRGRLPVVIAGGCLAAVGVIAGLQRTGRSFSTLWFDAHGDFNTPETTPSGYWDGMALAAICGRSLAPVFRAIEIGPLSLSSLVHIGGRALDPAEVEDFDRLQITRIEPQELARRWPEVRERVDPQDYYLHIDLDALDPKDAPALRLPVQEGLRLDDLLEHLSGLARPPLALTLAGMSFEKADSAQATQQLEVCLRLIGSAIESRG